MTCPNCGAVYEGGDICPNCKMNVMLFLRTRAASVRLYNKGLDMAASKNLSEAEKALRQSIAFYKKNYMARNLLGLVYFETGRVPSALREWIISASINKEDPTSKRYIDDLQKYPRLLEKNNDSIVMYNQAVSYLANKSEDLAVIQLKKAIDLNPKFITAYNLLTLCYIINGDLQMAKSVISAVLSIDVSNPIALNYARELGYDMGRLTDVKLKKTSKAQNDKISDAIPAKKISYNRKGSKIAERRIFILGVIITAAVMTTLAIPAWIWAKNDKIKQLNTEISSLQAKIKETEDMRADYTALKEENDKYKAAELLAEGLKKLDEAKTLFTSENFEESAKTIYAIDTANFDDTAMAQLTSLKEQVYPEAANSFYNRGKSAFLNGNGEQAMPYFEDVLIFAGQDVDYIDDTLYYLAKIFEGNNDKERAVSYYQRVIDEFPSSNQLSNAKNALESLNNPAQ